jgi:hypothetical protein
MLNDTDKASAGAGDFKLRGCRWVAQPALLSQ